LLEGSDNHHSTLTFEKRLYERERIHPSLVYGGYYIMRDIIDRQIAYYRARAGEYDEWLERKGRYDYGPEQRARWFEETAEVARMLRGYARVDYALDVAAGTGLWTKQLACRARHVVALDASPEMIALNRSKVRAENVEYRQVDVFTWEPDRQYDLIFCGFWLSHVLPALLPDFLATLRSALSPKGRLFIVDTLPSPDATAKDHPTPDASAELSRRRLNDGREFEIVKVYYSPNQLKARLDAAGMDSTIWKTNHYFLYAVAKAAESASKGADTRISASAGD
jgi:trans-aconitate methyltransferase